MKKLNEVDVEPLMSIASRRGDVLKRFLIILSLVSLFFATAVDSYDYTDTQEFKNKIARVEQWRDLVEVVMRVNGYSFNAGKVLALIAQESSGLPWVVASDLWGSTGLMQVGPRAWTPTQAQLKDPRTNIEWGLAFLNGALKLADGDWYTALRYYNCGEIRAEENVHCGVEYATQILEFYYPYFYKLPKVICWRNHCLEP